MKFLFVGLWAFFFLLAFSVMTHQWASAEEPPAFRYPTLSFMTHQWDSAEEKVGTFHFPSWHTSGPVLKSHQQVDT